MRLAEAVPDPKRTFCTVETLLKEGRAYREILRVADEQKIDLSPLFGPEMQTIVDRVYETPKQVLEKAIEISAVAQK